MKFEFRSRNYPVAPEVVSAELMRIWEASGKRLLPADVIEAAADVASPLHPCFEWDDEAAANKYRLHEARLLIRNIRVVTERGETRPFFVHVRLEETDKKVARFYQHAETLLTRPNEYLAGLAELRRKLEAITRSFEELQNYAKKNGIEDVEIQKLAVIVSALATAKSVAEHLQ